MHYWYLIPGIPIAIWLFVKLMRKFKHGRIGWDLFMLKVPIFGQLDRKEHPGPHHAHPGHAGGQRRADSGSAEHHPRDGGNAMFERMYGKVTEAIREGESDRQAA